MGVLVGVAVEARGVEQRAAQLLVDRRLDGLDAGVQLLGRDLQPLALRMEHGQQLAPARDQGREPLLALIGQGAQEALQIVAAQQEGLGELRGDVALAVEGVREDLRQAAEDPGGCRRRGELGKPRVA